MAMQTTSNNSEGEPMMEINTTPLIDVMLVLIIMLIITIPVQLHAVNLDLPSGTAPAAVVEPRVVAVDIDFDGTVSWNGSALADRVRELLHRQDGVVKQYVLVGRFSSAAVGATIVHVCRPPARRPVSAAAPARCRRHGGGVVRP